MIKPTLHSPFLKGIIYEINDAGYSILNFAPHVDEDGASA